MQKENQHMHDHKKNGKGICCSKKFWCIGGGISFLLLFLIYPLVTGTIVKKKGEEILKDVELRLKSQGQFSWKFEGGLYSSKISVQGSFENLNKDSSSPLASLLGQDGKGIHYKGTGTISHFTGTSHLNLGIDSEGNSSILSIFKVMPTLEVVSQVGIFGKGKHDFKLSPFQTKFGDEDGSSIDFSGLKGKLHLDSENWPQLLDINLEGLVLKENIRIRKLKNVGMILRVDKKTKTMDGSAEFYFDLYDDLDQVFGPGIIEFAVKNLDSETVTKLQRTLAELRDDQGKSTADEAKMKVMMNVMGLVTGFMKHSPSFEISQLKLKTPQGDLLGNAKFEVGKVAAGLGPLGLLSALKLSVQGTAPRTVAENLVEQLVKMKEIKNIQDQSSLQGDKGKELLEEIAERAKSQKEAKIQEFLDKNYLIPNKDGLSFRMEFKNGSLLVNDKPLSIQPQ